MDEQLHGGQFDGQGVCTTDDCQVVVLPQLKISREAFSMRVSRYVRVDGKLCHCHTTAWETIKPPHWVLEMLDGDPE